MSAFYVYIFYDRGVPCYVGKGCGDRFLTHLGRPDFPDIDHLSVTFRGHATEMEALRDECQLINRFGLRVEGGLLLNKVVPPYSLVNGHSQATFHTFKDMIKMEESEFMNAVPGFMAVYGIGAHTRLKAVCDVTGYSAGTMTAVAKGDTSIPRAGTPSRPYFATKELLVALYRHVVAGKKKRQQSQGRKSHQFGGKSTFDDLLTV